MKISLIIKTPDFLHLSCCPRNHPSIRKHTSLGIIINSLSFWSLTQDITNNCESITMQGPTFVPPGHVSSMQIFEEFLQFYGDEWSRTESGSQQHSTNAEALGYVFDHYMFRMGDVNKVVLFGWRDPGLISELRALYNNVQVPDFVLSKLRSNMTQLAIALKILQFLEHKFEFKEFELHVCSENLSEATQARLRELRITTFPWHELRGHIDGNSFVYDVTNDSAIFRASVVHRGQEIRNSPPVVLTHMNSWLPNGELDQ